MSDNNDNLNQEFGKDSKFYEAFSKVRSWVSVSLGIILTLVGVIAIFLIASLEGTKEVKASNRDSGYLLSEWRIINEFGENTYPDPKVDIMFYKNREYYFIVNEYDPETREVLEWYWAYDAGVGYVFKDVKFYVLTALTIMISLYVAQVNYVSSIRSGINTQDFQKTLVYYKRRKFQIENHTQFLPDFCFYKNTQTYEIAKRDIVEDAGISWEKYTNKDFNPNTLEKWQKKQLKRIKKIRVMKIHTSDLLQEHGSILKRINLLPISQQQHQRRFLIFGGFQKIIGSALSGLVVSMGAVLGNWSLGGAYAFVVLSSYVSAIVIATDFVQTTLRNRYVAKADLLGEFDNIKQKFIDEKKALETSKQVIEPKKETDNHPCVESIEIGKADFSTENVPRTTSSKIVFDGNA